MTNYIVTGFFTPDKKYAALASAFRERLDVLEIQHAIYECSFAGGWDQQLRAKPETVLRAMKEHPGKSVILMDIDCILRGAIDSITFPKGDVALHFRSKVSRKRFNMWPSSRCIVFGATPKAELLAAVWQHECQNASSVGGDFDDEHLLMNAISKTPGVTIEILHPHFAAHEIDEIGDSAVIVHQSAHDEARHAWSFQKALKRRRRALIARITGKPYMAWKYGSTLE